MKLITIILTLIPFLAFAELVKGPAEVWTDDKHTVLLRLDDSITVTADPMEEHWYRISFSFNADTNDFREDGFTLKKEAVLKMASGKRIGVALADIKVPTYAIHNGIREAAIEAIQIREDNIYTDSDIEQQFMDILSQRAFQLSDFRKHFALHKYHSWIDSATFKTFVLYGACAECIPVIRVLSIFDSDKLFCVIHYSKIDYANCLSRTSVREFQVSYYSSDKMKISEFENIYFPIILRAD